MIGVGVIGYGYWGPNLLRNFAETRGASVRMVCDLRAERLELAAARYPGITTTSDVTDLIHDPSVDAIAIATPVSTHFTFARHALEAGKHVLLSKPMTATADEARTLIDLAA